MPGIPVKKPVKKPVNNMGQRERFNFWKEIIGAIKQALPDSHRVKS